MYEKHVLHGNHVLHEKHEKKRRINGKKKPKEY